MSAISQTAEKRFVNPEYKCLVRTAQVATATALLSVFAPWEPLRIIGVTVLTGFGYGIVNDSLACRDCIEYFTVGHTYDGRRLRHRPINTLDPDQNAVFWGSIATWHVCAIAGIFFALLSRMPFPGLAFQITAMQLVPYLVVGAGLVLALSHFVSRFSQSEMAKSPSLKFDNVPLDLQPGWEACDVRNGVGYCSLEIGGLLLSAAIVAARIGLFAL